MLAKSLEPEITYLEGNAIVPAKALSFKKDGDGKIVEVIKARTHEFENSLKAKLKREIEQQGATIFPTKKEVFVSIRYGLHAKHEYETLDLDNRSKTILDALKSVIYEDDCQVKFLVSDKHFIEHGTESYFLLSVTFLNKKIDKMLARRLANLRPASL